MDVGIKELQQKLLEMIKDFDIFCSENNLSYCLSGGNVLGAVRHKGFIPWDDDIDVQMPREDYTKLLDIYKNNDKYQLQKDTIDYPLQFSKLRANNTTFIEDIPYKKKYKKIHQGIYIDIFPVDKVAKSKLKAKLQVISSNILIAQSLFLRGYPNSHNSLKKRIIMSLSVLLLPIRKKLYSYVTKFNSQSDYDFVCSFYGTTSPKIFQKKKSFFLPFTKLQYEDIFLPVMNNYIDYLTDAYGDYMKLPSEEEIKYNIHAKIVDLNQSYTNYLENK